mgnify:CR=1 FL=1
MNSISIIVPIYKGKQYINDLMDILEKNSKNLNSTAKIELIFVNDYPEEDIEINSICKKIDVKVYNSKVNRGIHGARVFGLKHANGKYVVFLDQDDKISEDYLQKQLSKILENDFVVCNAYIDSYYADGVLKKYCSEEEQVDKIKFENFIKGQNQIVSPGQVLLKKEAISDVWINNIMKNNGADDYLLWLTLFSANKKCAINYECLYTHIEHGNNTSLDIEAMNKSLSEMVGIVERNNVFEPTVIGSLKNGIERTIYLNRLSKVVKIYDNWMYLKNRGKCVRNYLDERNIHYVAVYGMNKLGNRLVDELKMSGINVICGIDRRGSGMIRNVPIVKIDDDIFEYLEKIQMVIVTAETYFDEIKQAILLKKQIPVVSFSSIISELLN